MYILTHKKLHQCFNGFEGSCTLTSSLVDDISVIFNCVTKFVIEMKGRSGQLTSVHTEKNPSHLEAVGHFHD